MAKLTDVIHFRGEEITLFATFKGVDGQPNSEVSSTLNPQVAIYYVDRDGVHQLLASTAMIMIAPDRYYLPYTIPYTAPLTTYIVEYTATVNGVDTFATEQLIVGNPAISTSDNGASLRYGPHSSFLQRPRSKTIRASIALPGGQF